MQMTSETIGERGTLRAVETHKFKRNNLFLTRLLDISPETTPCDMLLLSVLSRQTSAYPSNALLSRRCEELYGAVVDGFVNFFGERLIMVLCGDFVSDSALGGGDEIARGVVGLLASIWQVPVLDGAGLLPEDEVEHAKQALCDSIRAADNDPAAYASRRCRELTCEGSPQGYTVSVADVEKITPERLTARYMELRKSGGFTAFYIGDQPAVQVTSLVSEYFGDACIGVTEPLYPHAVLPCGDMPRYVTEQRAVGQGKLCMAFYSGELMSDTDDYYATLMAVEVFGGSPVAKLFMNVRERLSLCYYCSAAYNKLGGIVYVSSGVSADKRNQAEREILAQLSQICRGNITDAELEAARLSLINSAIQIEDKPYSMWSFYEHRIRLGLDCSMERHIERIRNVTVSQIKDAAAKWRLGVVFFIQPQGGEDNEYDD